MTTTPIDRLLATPCVLVERRTVDPLDPDAELEDVIVGTSRCHLQQTLEGEAHDGRVQQTGWRVFLPADVLLAGWDALIVDGVTFELDGDPWRATSPLRGVASHVEAAARRVH